MALSAGFSSPALSSNQGALGVVVVASQARYAEFPKQYNTTIFCLIPTTSGSLESADSGPKFELLFKEIRQKISSYTLTANSLDGHGAF